MNLKFYSWRSWSDAFLLLKVACLTGFFSLALLYSVLPFSRSHAAAPSSVRIWCLSDSPVSCFNSPARPKTDIFRFLWFYSIKDCHGKVQNPPRTAEDMRPGWRQEGEGQKGAEAHFLGAVHITLSYLTLRHLKIGSSNLNSLCSLWRQTSPHRDSSCKTDIYDKL